MYGKAEQRRKLETCEMPSIQRMTKINNISETTRKAAVRKKVNV